MYSIVTPSLHPVSTWSYLRLDRVRTRPFSSLAGAVRVFPSEQAVIDYVRGEDYDSTADDSQTAAAAKSFLSVDGELFERDSRQDEGEFGERNGGLRPVEGGKVGMAVIFNKAPIEGGVATWDYTLRFNYTYGVSMFEDQVGGYCAVLSTGPVHWGYGSSVCLQATPAFVPH